MSTCLTVLHLRFTTKPGVWGGVRGGVCGCGVCVSVCAAVCGGEGMSRQLKKALAKLALDRAEGSEEEEEAEVYVEERQPRRNVFETFSSSEENGSDGEGDDDGASEGQSGDEGGPILLVRGSGKLTRQNSNGSRSKDGQTLPQSLAESVSEIGRDGEGKNEVSGLLSKEVPEILWYLDVNNFNAEFEMKKISKGTENSSDIQSVEEARLRGRGRKKAPTLSTPSAHQDSRLLMLRRFGWLAPNNELLQFLEEQREGKQWVEFDPRAEVYFKMEKLSTRDCGATGDEFGWLATERYVSLFPVLEDIVARGDINALHGFLQRAQFHPAANLYLADFYIQKDEFDTSHKYILRALSSFIPGFHPSFHINGSSTLGSSTSGSSTSGPYGRRRLGQMDERFLAAALAVITDDLVVDWTSLSNLPDSHRALRRSHQSRQTEVAQALKTPIIGNILFLTSLHLYALSLFQRGIARTGLEVLRFMHTLAPAFDHAHTLLHIPGACVKARTPNLLALYNFHLINHMRANGLTHSLRNRPRAPAKPVQSAEPTESAEPPPIPESAEPASTTESAEPIPLQSEPAVVSHDQANEAAVRPEQLSELQQPTEPAGPVESEAPAITTSSSMAPIVTRLDFFFPQFAFGNVILLLRNSSVTKPMHSPDFLEALEKIDAQKFWKWLHDSIVRSFALADDSVALELEEKAALNDAFPDCVSQIHVLFLRALYIFRTFPGLLCLQASMKNNHPTALDINREIHKGKIFVDSIPDYKGYTDSLTSSSSSSSAALKSLAVEIGESETTLRNMHLSLVDSYVEHAADLWIPLLKWVDVAARKLNTMYIEKSWHDVTITPASSTPLVVGSDFVVAAMQLGLVFAEPDFVLFYRCVRRSEFLGRAPVLPDVLNSAPETVGTARALARRFNTDGNSPLEIWWREFKERTGGLNPRSNVVLLMLQSMLPWCHLDTSG